MANNGFSAPVNYWGAIAGLTPKASSDGKTSQLSEAPNEYGDTAAHDEYGETLAPSVEYAVTGNVDLSNIVLGKIFTYPASGNNQKKIMLTTAAFNMQAGSPPTVTLSGVEVQSGATDFASIRFRARSRRAARHKTYSARSPHPTSSRRSTPRPPSIRTSRR